MSSLRKFVKVFFYKDYVVGLVRLLALNFYEVIVVLRPHQLSLQLRASNLIVLVESEIMKT